MLLPVSRILSLTALGTKNPVESNSCLYFARKRIELSTEIPNVILNIKAVLAFNGMLKYPINPAVIINAIRLGINEIRIIRAFAKSKAIESVMRIQASIKLSVRLSIRFLLPLMNIFEDPVIVTLTLSAGPLRFFSSSAFKCSVFGSITWWIRESILFEPISAICIDTLIFVYDESMNDLKSPLA